jgi:DNA-binding transcriptional MerR regulator
MTMEEPAQFSLEELAARADMTVRNIRAYRTRGLLQPPLRNGRLTLYGPEHLVRLFQVRLLREAGVPLTMIAQSVRAGESLASDGPLHAWLNAGRPVADGSLQDLDGELLARMRGADPGAVERLDALGVLETGAGAVRCPAAVVRALRELELHQVPMGPALRAIVVAAEAARALWADIGSSLPVPLPAMVPDLLAGMTARVLHDGVRRRLRGAL